MYDPMTQAFQINYPWVSSTWTTPSGVVHKYRSPFITIWHVDPECDGSDDSCGWFNPPIDQKEWDKFKAIARQEYSDIFGKQYAVREKKDYAYICYEPTCYDAIYWSWRRIGHELRPRGPWKFGTRLSSREMEEIFHLTSNPIDNLRNVFKEVRDEGTFESLFMYVYRSYKRFHRPWYKHPRWHFWHWRFQVHPRQAFRRWLLTRCEGCGKGFKYGESPVSHSWHSEPPKLLRGERGLYHSDCSGKCYALKHAEPAGHE